LNIEKNPIYITLIIFGRNIDENKNSVLRLMIMYIRLAEKVSGMPALPIGRQVQSGRKKMYAYTSNEPNLNQTNRLAGMVCLRLA
jgi:hypothetical protein